MVEKIEYREVEVPVDRVVERVREPPLCKHVHTSLFRDFDAGWTRIHFCVAEFLPVIGHKTIIVLLTGCG